MRDHVLLFFLLGLLLMAVVILIFAPGARDLGAVPSSNDISNRRRP
jgi:hypothetical protein